MTTHRETTVLFADVTGSTRLYEEAGDRRATEAIRKCLDVVRDATEASGGRVVKTIGDELMALFPNPDRATQAATRMHMAVDALPPIEGQKLSLRIGFHAGPVIQRDGDIFGDTVNIASRLTGQATKGQVLTSADTATKLTPLLRGATRRLYDVTVKGKAADVSLCEVLWSASPDITDVPLGQAEQPATNARLRLRVGPRELVRRRRLESITIGRDPKSTLVIADASASRHHCVIERRRNHFVIRDHSSNGTFILVDGDKDDIVLRREEVVLRSHGWITFGRPKNVAAEVAEYFCEEDPKVKPTVRSRHLDQSAILKARRYHAALEELFSKSVSGCSPYHTMLEVDRLCTAAWQEIEDNQCREQLDLIQMYAKTSLAAARYVRGSLHRSARIDAEIQTCLRALEARLARLRAPSAAE